MPIATMVLTASRLIAVLFIRPGDQMTGSDLGMACTSTPARGCIHLRRTGKSIPHKTPRLPMVR
jgi:hypothetical protein